MTYKLSHRRVCELKKNKTDLHASALNTVFRLVIALVGSNDDDRSSPTRGLRFYTQKLLFWRGEVVFGSMLVQEYFRILPWFLVIKEHIPKAPGKGFGDDSTR